MGLQMENSKHLKVFNKIPSCVDRSQTAVTQFHSICSLLQEISEGYKNNFPSNNLCTEYTNCSNKNLESNIYEDKKPGFMRILHREITFHQNKT